MCLRVGFVSFRDLGFCLDDGWVAMFGCLALLELCMLRVLIPFGLRAGFCVLSVGCFVFGFSA